jgi:hypothetical protein
VPAGFRLFEDGLAVPEHFEAPAFRRNHFDVHVGKMLRELSRQTGSSGLIVSKGAVFDSDSHLERSERFGQ